MTRLNIVSFIICAAALFMFAGCAPSPSYRTSSKVPASSDNPMADIYGSEDAPERQVLEPSPAPVKVGLLLPLSGQHRDLGQAMLQAAQMALFDTGQNNFELMPRDTAGTGAGARQAGESALKDGAQLLLGPVFADSVRAVQPLSRRANVNMIAFSTDWTLAGSNTYLLGFTPFDQVERILRYSADNNLRNMGVIAPDSAYGRAVVNVYEKIAPRYGIRTVQVARLGGNDTAALQDFAQNGAGRINAVFMPLGGQQAVSVSGQLARYGMPVSQVQRLGTGLLDDPALLTGSALNGIRFAAPSPRLRSKFEQDFRQSYGFAPPRLATLAYDATALAAVLTERGLQSRAAQPAFDRQAILNPNGFFGLDGIFRFKPDGTAERGLAVLEILNGSLAIIDPAPETFQATVN